MTAQRIIILVLGSWMMSGPACLLAQPGQDSVVEAAKQAQAEKKRARKAKLTIDNDNLDTLKGTINVVGQEPAPPEDKSKAAAGDKTQKPASAAPSEKAAVKDESYWRQRFADASKKLTDDQRELDILQRERNLKQEQFYTDPMASLKQQYSRQDLNDTKAKIDEKTAAIAQDKQDIDNLQDELRQAGGDPGWSQPAPQTQPTAQP